MGQPEPLFPGAGSLPREHGVRLDGPLRGGGGGRRHRAGGQGRRDRGRRLDAHEQRGEHRGPVRGARGLDRPQRRRLRDGRPRHARQRLLTRGDSLSEGRLRGRRASDGRARPRGHDGGRARGASSGSARRPGALRRGRRGGSGRAVARAGARKEPHEARQGIDRGRTMTIDSVGIRAVAVHFPRGVRTNRFWYNHHPEIVAAVVAKKKQRIWAAPERKPDDAADPNDTFDAEMAAYLIDPFRGTIERRVRAPGESSLTLETTVAKKAMAAAQLEPKDIDLLIVSSFLPDHFECMDAQYVARDLGLRGMAFNLESACASAMVGLQTACGLVKSGQYRNVLVVASCTYSRDTDTRDTISWTSGDGAGAFVVSEVEKGYGRLGGKGIHTGGTCGKLWFENY